MNLVGSLCLQLVTVLSGFIVPRLIIGEYGSEINAIVNSAAQFLGYIALLESGVGGVVRAALYKPLAENNYLKVSSIISATQRFFRRICYIFIAYSVVLACIFPFVIDGDYSWAFTSSLVVIISISTVGEYYFGITNQLMLFADQRRYIAAFIQSATYVLNVIIVILCVKLHASVHVMKLLSTTVFFLRPVAMNLYVRKCYPIDRKAKPDEESIKQRWDGLGHHIAFFFHTNTDVAILTVFSKLSVTFELAEVSVYAVYSSVVTGVEKLATMLHQSVEAAFGDILARGEKDVLRTSFRMYEQMTFAISTFAFTCTAILIIPFVRIYTDGVTDINYIRPVFAYVLVLAKAVYCIRMPYMDIALSAGHYKQTKKGAYVETAVNIGLSIILVVPFGLTGVALGTLAAMVVRTTEYVLYVYKNFIGEKFMSFIMRIICASLTAALSVFTARLFSSDYVDSYFTFAVYAVFTAAVCAVWSVICNLLFYRKDTAALLVKCRNMLMNFIRKN